MQPGQDNGPSASEATSTAKPAARKRNPLGTLVNGALVLACVAMVGAVLFAGDNAVAESAVKIPAPAADVSEPATGLQKAVFAGGCFWGIQAVFQHTKGVTQAVSGYAGGAKDKAVYEVVSRGNTGHAESVQVTYDPKQVSYGQLLQIYFSVAHDPTQLNQQFPDHGTQYRSAIFFTNALQQQAAQKYIAQLDAAKVYREKIVTEVTPLPAFYPAEGYHQDYATLHPDQPYIATYDLPKIGNLKTLFPGLYRDAPVLVGKAG